MIKIIYIKKLYIYIYVYVCVWFNGSLSFKYVCFGFVWFHGISTIVGHIMPKPFHICILNI